MRLDFTAWRLKEWLFLISGLFAVFLLIETALTQYAYNHAISDGTLDAVEIALQHPEVISRVGPVRSYRVFFWSLKSTTEGDREAFRVRVLVLGESEYGAANVRLYREGGGRWSPSRLDFLIKGQTVSVPGIGKWYSAVQDQVESHPPPLRRELPIPISPGIISTAVAIGVMGVWLLILTAYARWMLRLRKSRGKAAPEYHG